MAFNKRPRARRQITHNQALAVISGQAVFFTMLGLALWYLSGRDMSAYLQPSWDGVVKGMLLGGAAIVVAWGSFLAFPRFSEKLIRMQGSVYHFLNPPFSFPAIVWISICAGIGEEALFRGGLQTVLGDLLGPVIAILLSSFVFTVIHGTKPLISLILFGISLIFGAIYWYSGNLLLVMIAHALYDVFALTYLQRELHRLKVFGAGDDKAVENAINHTPK